MDVSWMKCWWLQKNCIKLTILLFHLKYPLLTELKTERKWESVCASCVFCTTIKTILVFYFKNVCFFRNSPLKFYISLTPFPFSFIFELWHIPWALNICKCVYACNLPTTALWGSCNGNLDIGLFHFWERNLSGIFGHG